MIHILGRKQSTKLQWRRFVFFLLLAHLFWNILHVLAQNIQIQGASRTSSSDKGKALLNHRSVSLSPPTMSGPVSSRSLSLSLISVGTNTKYLRTILALEFQSRNKVTENRGENSILGLGNTCPFFFFFS